MSEMVERVARAIVDAYNSGVPVGVHFDMLPDHARASAERQARAAIEAMRVPSEAMERKLNSWACCAGYIDKGWSAAIDEGLK